MIGGGGNVSVTDGGGDGSSKKEGVVKIPVIGTITLKSCERFQNFQKSFETFLG